MGWGASDMCMSINSFSAQGVVPPKENEERMIDLPAPSLSQGAFQVQAKPVKCVGYVCVCTYFFSIDSSKKKNKMNEKRDLP